ncbi:hypothetical protein [Parafilimonas terrae]|uniref:Uncharacterized protein n=1 Tax=Parafilimonas terrae TaxID=1465490 RepID=A0A1I5YH99_9BACT|nr:hypothetical protein [Parafilimonas terrae]SFQ43555.1 hypothetical protein SAMN05444277_11243 [Parafilimonas terrae]
MNKILLSIIFLLFSAVMANAQTTEKRMSPMQKEQAAKADVYIANLKKKISDSTQFVIKDSATIAIKQEKNCRFKKKKSP